MTDNDRTILRDLARRYMEVCSKPEIDERRDLWRQHNSLKRTRPLIYVRAFAWKEMPEARLACEDPFFRHFENFFRHQLFWDSMADDSIFEPWVTLHATYRCAGWGVSGERHRSGEEGGSFKVDYPLKLEEDIERLRPPRHEIDEEATARDASRLADAIGDIITINVDRGPAYRMWTGDISTDLGYLRGIENFMVDMYDRPAWLHRLVGFMRDGILRTHEQAEAAGDWGLSAHQNQAMPYAEELADPAANVERGAAQAVVGLHGRPGVRAGVARHARRVPAPIPAPHLEPVRAGRLRLLRGPDPQDRHAAPDSEPAPHRRLAVRGRREVRRADRHGLRALLSPQPGRHGGLRLRSRPHPVDPAPRPAGVPGCHTDITLKDVETVQGDPNRVRQWVALTRQVIDEVHG